MTDRLDALRTSVERLRTLVTPLSDEQLDRPAYPTEWSIAGVLSHIGSGAVIMQRRLEDSLREQPTPDEFAPSVWDEWNAKSSRERADDALVADRAFIERIGSLTDAQAAALVFTMGPLRVDLDGLLGLRLNEHAMHTWDVEVALDPAATIPAGIAAFVVESLDLIARYTAKPSGDERTVTVHTTDPARDFTLVFTPGAVAFMSGSGMSVDGGDAPDLELPAEAFARLLYGRLDPDHTPPFAGDPELLDLLRRTYPGP